MLHADMFGKGQNPLVNLGKGNFQRSNQVLKVETCYGYLRFGIKIQKGGLSFEKVWDNTS